MKVLSLCIIFLSFSLFLCVPLPPNNRNPENMDTHTLIENIIIPESVIECADSKYLPDSNGIWSFDQLAHAFFEFGIKLWNFPNPTDRTQHIDECVAALIIASGECQPIQGKIGCSAAGSGQSGKYMNKFVNFF